MSLPLMIVVIEDNANSARLAQRLLERAGHNVVTASDGESGLEVVTAHTPDIVLIDLGLPDVDGQTIIGILRQLPRPSPLAAVAFTAWPIDTAQAMVEAYGFNGLIAKPINTRTFADQVAAFLPKLDSDLG